MQQPIHKYFLDRQICLQHMNDGFAIVCGEKHREFLTKLSAEMVDLGVQNGRKWAYDSVLKSDKIYMQYEMAAKGIMEQAKVDAMEKDLRTFFTDAEIEVLKQRSDREVHPALYAKGLGQYERLIVDTVKEEDMTGKNPKPFEYFKQFPTSRYKEYAKSVTLHGESGIGLDRYKPKSIEYDRFEGELCYPIENICRAYHYLGMLLGKQEVLLEWADKIERNLKPETDYMVRQMMASVIYSLCIDSAADDVIHALQAATGVTDAFMTRDQVSQSLKRWANSKEGKQKLKELEESFKKKNEQS